MAGSVGGNSESIGRNIPIDSDLQELQPGSSPGEEDEFAAAERAIAEELKQASGMSQERQTLVADRQATFQDLTGQLHENAATKADISDEKETKAELEKKVSSAEAKINVADQVTGLLDDKAIAANRAVANAQKEVLSAKGTVDKEAANVRNLTKENIGLNAQMNDLQVQIDARAAQINAQLGHIKSQEEQIEVQSARVRSVVTQAQQTPEGQMALKVANGTGRYLMLAKEVLKGYRNAMVLWDGKNRNDIVAIEEDSTIGGNRANVTLIAGKAPARALANNPRLVFHVVNAQGQVVQGHMHRIMELGEFDRVYNTSIAIISERVAQRKLEEQRAAEQAARDRREADQNAFRAQQHNQVDQQKTQNDMIAWLRRTFDPKGNKLTRNFLQMLQELTQWATEMNQRIEKRMHRQAEKIKEVHKRVDAEDLSQARLHEDLEKQESVSRTDAVTVSSEGAHDGSRLMTRTQTIRQGHNRVRSITSQSAKINGHPKTNPEDGNGLHNISRTRRIQ